MKNIKSRIIACDFDGTLCEDAEFPKIGEPKKEVIEWIKAQKYIGHKIILWTCRDGSLLRQAVEWCAVQGIFFDAINDNIPECKFHDLGHKKILADIYLDDKAMKVSQVKEIFNASEFKRAE